MPLPIRERSSTEMQVMELDRGKVVKTVVQHNITKQIGSDITCTSSSSSSSPSSSSLLSSCSSINLSTASTKAPESINKEENLILPSTSSSLPQLVTLTVSQTYKEQELEKQKLQREFIYNLREQRALHSMSATQCDCWSTTGKCVTESALCRQPSSLQQKVNNINAWCDDKMHGLADLGMTSKQILEWQHNNATNKIDSNKRKSENNSDYKDSNLWCNIISSNNNENKHHSNIDVREKEKLLQSLQMHQDKIHELQQQIRLLEKSKNKELNKLQEKLKNEIATRQSIEISFDELLSLVDQLRSTTSLQLSDSTRNLLENRFTNTKEESVLHKGQENKLYKHANPNTLTQTSAAGKLTLEHKAISEPTYSTHPAKPSHATLSDVFWCKLREREERARSRVRKELIERYETTIHTLQCDKKVLAETTTAAECNASKMLEQNTQLQEQLHQVKLNEERINTLLREKEMVVHALTAKVKILYRQIDDKQSERVNEENNVTVELTRKCEELENTVHEQKEVLSKLQKSSLLLEKEVACKQVQLESCSHELQIAINENADLRQELASRKEAEIEMERTHKHYKENDHMREVQIATLKTSLQSKDALIATLQHEIEELRTSCQVREEEMSAMLQEKHCALQKEILHEREQIEHELRNTQLVNRSLSIQLENLQNALHEANMFKCKTQTHHVNSEVYSREVLLASLQSEIAALQKAWSESRDECAAERQCRMTEVLQLSETITNLKEENSFLMQMVAERDGEVKRLGWHECTTPVRAIADKTQNAIINKTEESNDRKESKQKHFSWPSLPSLPSSTNTQPTMLCSQLSLEHEEEEEEEQEWKKQQEWKDKKMHAERERKEPLEKSFSSHLHETAAVNVAQGNTLTPLSLPRSSAASLESSSSSTLFSSTRSEHEHNQQSARCLFAPTPSPPRKSCSRSNTPTPSTVMNVLTEHNKINITSQSNNNTSDEMRYENVNEHIMQKEYTNWNDVSSYAHATQQEKAHDCSPVDRKYVFCPQPLLPRPRKSVMLSNETQCTNENIHDSNNDAHKVNSVSRAHNVNCNVITYTNKWNTNHNCELVTTPRETGTFEQHK